MNTLLGEFDSVTVVLLKAQFPSELPLKKDLKDLLDVKDIHFFKRNGIHEDDISMLEFSLGIAREPIVYKQLCSYPNYLSTDIIITKPDVKGNIFANLKYDSKLIEGFNLSGTCLTDLRSLIKNHILAMDVKLSAMEWLKNAQSNADLYKHKNIIDKSVTEFDLQKLQDFVDIYGTLGLTNARSDIANWVTKYCWN